MGQNMNEALRNGLRRDARMPLGTPFLSECRNLKVSEFGLVEFESFADVFPGVPVRHPFPQYFKGKGKSLLAAGDQIYTVDETTFQHSGEFTINALSTYDIYAATTKRAIPRADGAWQFVDFHSTWFLFNGDSIIFKTLEPLGGASGSTVLQAREAFIQDRYNTNGITIRTGCDFRGRMLMGGFDPTNFWNPGWDTEWAAQVKEGIAWGFPMGAPEKNWIWWSSIGGGDLLNFFLPARAIEDVASIDDVYSTILSKERYVFGWERNESNFMPMDWQGAVLVVKPLRNHIFVGGEDGISAVTPHNTEIGSTFGLEENLLRIGIASRTAVGGSLKRLIFLDNNGTLWSIDNDLNLERLGFEEYLKQMIGNEITICFDPEFSEYYISDKNVSFVLAKDKLSERGKVVTSVYNAIRSNDLPDLVGVEGPSTIDSEINIVSSIFRVESAGNLSKVRVIGEALKGLSIEIRSRYSTLDDFELVASSPLDPLGVARVNVSGQEFEVRLVGEPIDGMKIVDIIPEFVDRMEFSTALG